MKSGPNELASFVMFEKIDKNGVPYYFSKSKNAIVDFSKAVTFLYPIKTPEGANGYRLVVRKGHDNNNEASG